jgi:hypothetical protein
MQAAVTNEDSERRFAQLESEIVALSVRIYAETYQLLERIRELDELTDWEALGFRSCAHWLNFRVGIDVGAAREKVRVARALKALPRICDAMRKGSVSYAKVRAMTRIATPENEEALLSIAEYGTASHVERTVRLCRRTASLAPEQAEAQREGRSLSVWFDDDGLLRIEGRLPPVEGALVMKAVESVEDELWREEKGRARASQPALEPQSIQAPESPIRAQPHMERASRPQRLADALARVAERALASRCEETGDSDRYQVVVHVDAEVLRDGGSGTGTGICAIERGPALSPESARRLGCSASVVELHEDGHGNVLDLRRKRRSVSRPLLRALKYRDGGCRFPGCTCERGCQSHHVHHWADGGGTDLGNLVTLCALHHWLVHEGGFGVSKSPDGRLVFHDRRGRVLPQTPPALPSLDGVCVSAETPMPEVVQNLSTWDGEPMDWAMAVDAVMQ